MVIEIDFNSDEALYIQLRNQIIMGIAKDILKDGESLPSVRQLANELGVNMHTVITAAGWICKAGPQKRSGGICEPRKSNQSYAGIAFRYGNDSSTGNL